MRRALQTQRRRVRSPFTKWLVKPKAGAGESDRSSDPRNSTALDYLPAREKLVRRRIDRRTLGIILAFSGMSSAAIEYPRWRERQEIERITAAVNARPAQPYKVPCPKGYYWGSARWPNDTTCYKIRR